MGKIPEMTNAELKELEDSVVDVNIRFKTESELYSYSASTNQEVIKIVNIPQIMFYAELGVQPDLIMPSVFNGRLVAYYLSKRTGYVWYKWRRSGLSQIKENKINIRM